jgi:hypothetical protein
MSGIADPFRSRRKRVMAASAPVVHPIDEMSYLIVFDTLSKTINRILDAVSNTFLAGVRLGWTDGVQRRET